MSVPVPRPVLAPLPYFFASFVSVSLQSVIPQHHLAGRPPDERALLLSACLLAGAVGSLTGVGASRRLAAVIDAWPPDRWRAVIAAAAAMLVVSFSGTLTLDAAALYVACFFAASAASQFAFDALDRRLVAAAGDGLVTHVRQAAAGQLLAFVLGPLWFGGLAGAVPAHVVAIATGVTLMVLLAWRLPAPRGGGPIAGAAPGPVRYAERGHADPADAASDLDDRLFFAFTVLVHAAVFVFVSSVLYVARDFYGRADAARVTGLVLAVSNLVAAATVMIARGAGTAAPAAAGWGPGQHARATLVLLSCLALVAWAPVASVWWLAACALPTGGCYGLFLVRARAYASRRAADAGRAGFLSRFNNLANVAALLAFGLLFLVALITPRGSGGYVAASLGASGGLLIGALATAALAGWRLDARRRPIPAGRLA